jgi:putative salt-induced outer membrane protein YdiY
MQHIRMNMIRRCFLFFLLCSVVLNASMSSPAAAGAEKETEQIKYPLEINFAVGGGITGGNNSTRTATVDSEIQKQYPRFRLRFNGKGAYGEARYSGGPWIESANNWLISARLDWFTTSQLHNFLFTQAATQSNQYRGYWLKNSVQLGYGIRLFGDSESIDLILPLGIDYARDVLVVDDRQKPENFSAVLKPELTVTFNSNLRYRQKTNLFIDFRGDEDYRVDTDNILDVTVTKGFTLRMAYTINFNNKPRLIREVDQTGQPTGERIPARPTDHIFTTSVMIRI